MASHASLYLPATHVLRPERRDPHTGAVERFVHGFIRNLAGICRARLARASEIIPLVNRHETALEKMSDKALAGLAADIRHRLYREGLKKGILGEAFALVREVSTRTLGLRHFDVQLMGGWILLKGMVAEMETGEGKTLTATLAAGAAALAGVPVHIITVNDYLTSRDAEWMRPVYETLGLTVGCVNHETSPEQRKEAYQCDITYCTNKEIAFDYLRDRVSLKDRQAPLRLQAEYLHGTGARVRSLLMRGLHYAIVDEADSILIDECRTPLLIAKKIDSAEEDRFYEQAVDLAGQLKEEVHYRRESSSRKITLTDKGKSHIKELASSLGGPWQGSIRREDIIRNALTALYMFKRDVDYLVRDNKVQIVDEFTGRVMPDRSWERGLHQLIETKEGCEITSHQETVARISYQQFFRRYLKLSGMTGTAKEVEGELNRVYGLPVVRIPTNRSMKRLRHPSRVSRTTSDKWQLVIDRVRRLINEDRPVLIGTRSVAASEQLSTLLKEAGLNHQVLNAKQDQEEADIIARAGNRASITIATNMAGRGTDIKLGPGVAGKGGLYVILTERHEAGRIDRQLAGRCGRQGDPGGYEAILSLEDPIVAEQKKGLLTWITRGMIFSGLDRWDGLGDLIIKTAQKKTERMHSGMRRAMLRADEQLRDMLSFSGLHE